MTCLYCETFSASWEVSEVARYLACPRCGWRASYVAMASFGITMEEVLASDRYEVQRARDENGMPWVAIVDTMAANARLN